MTKRQNTVLFVILGTLANIFITLFFILILTVLCALIFKNYLSQLLPVCLIGGILLGVFAYQKVSLYIIKKYNLEEKLDPLFSSKKNLRR